MAQEGGPGVLVSMHTARRTLFSLLDSSKKKIYGLGVKQAPDRETLLRFVNELLFEIKDTLGDGRVHTYPAMIQRWKEWAQATVDGEPDWLAKVRK